MGNNFRVPPCNQNPHSIPQNQWALASLNVGDEFSERTTDNSGNMAGLTYVSSIRRKCPVPCCEVITSQIRRHWREVHVEKMEKFTCLYCSFMSKRRWSLLGHIRMKHGLMDPEQGVGSIVYENNDQFKDPTPFTINDALQNIP